MTSISTTTTPTHRVLVVAPHGDLTADDCPALRAALREATAEATLVVVDLLEVRTLDDAVVQVLVGASARCGAQGVQLVVANADAQPWTALTLARVAGVVRLHRRGTPPLAELLHLIES